MSRFQFVADHRDTFEVKRLCEVIEVNRSSFYAWDAATAARLRGLAQRDGRVVLLGGHGNIGFAGTNQARGVAKVAKIGRAPCLVNGTEPLVLRRFERVSLVLPGPKDTLVATLTAGTRWRFFRRKPLKRYSSMAGANSNNAPFTGPPVRTARSRVLRGVCLLSTNCMTSTR